jgi:hypothetical protein
MRLSFSSSTLVLLTSLAGLSVGSLIVAASVHAETTSEFSWFVEPAGKTARMERFGIARSGTAMDDARLVADCRSGFVSVAVETAPVGRLVAEGELPFLRMSFGGESVDVAIASLHVNEMGPEDWDVRTRLDTELFTRIARAPNLHLAIVGRTPDHRFVTRQDLGETTDVRRAEVLARVQAECRVKGAGKER